MILCELLYKLVLFCAIVRVGKNSYCVAGVIQFATDEFGMPICHLAVGNYVSMAQVENFYLAFNSIDGKNICDDKVANGFLEGIKLTQNELKKVFDKHGLARIFPENEDFNPDLHNAITQVESDKDDGKIVEVMQAGYKIKEPYVVFNATNEFWDLFRMF